MELSRRPTRKGFVAKVQQAFDSCLQTHGRTLRRTVYLLLIVLFSAYLCYCLYYDFKNSIAVLVLAILVLLVAVYLVLKAKVGHRVGQKWHTSGKDNIRAVWKYGRWAWYIILLLGFIALIVIDLRDRLEQLISIAGLFTFVIICFLASSNPAKINWRVIMNGMIAQLILGVVVLKWETGAVALEWVAAKLVGFLNFALYGAEFVFGEKYTDHPFAMVIAPVLCFFAAVVNVLCYWGVMQFVIKALGSIIKFFIGSTKVECFVVIAAVFLGPDVPCLMIRSMIPALSVSQLLTVMSSSLSTMDAGMFPVYESMGIPASHLVASSLISAPATIVISKLLYPETNKKTKEEGQLVLDKTEAVNSIDAFARGAGMSIPIIGAMLSVLIAFVALLEFINTTLTWMGDRAGIEDLTLQFILGYILIPLAYLMGVEWTDCRIVGELLGLKTIVNEYVAYVELGHLIENRKLGLEPSISVRSETIAAYALSGYSNIGTVGYMVGFLAAMAPTRSRDIASMSMKALVSSSLACFMTGAVAGLLYQG